MAQSGGCLCGAVRYELQGEPVMAFLCHCTSCQKQSGAAYSVNLLLPEAQLTLEGALTTYDDTGDSGKKVYRKFCGTCGSPIFSGLEAAPGIIALKAGTLDDPSTVTPAMEAWCDSRQAWLSAGGDRIEFPANPPAG